MKIKIYSTALEVEALPWVKNKGETDKLTPTEFSRLPNGVIVSALKNADKKAIKEIKKMLSELLSDRSADLVRYIEENFK